MPRTKLHQTSFAGGELSPTLVGRMDRESYFAGALRLRNVYIQPAGGVITRPGTQYITGTTTNQAARLVPFQFNIDQTYLLVFTPAEMKVYKDDALQATVTSGLSGLTAAIINEMDYVQSLDTLILVHEDIQPIQIVRSSDTSWAASNLSLSNIPNFDFGSGSEAVWSSTRGWPRSATFFKQRLWFGGSKSRPSTFWGSKLADFFDFNLGTGADDEAIEATIDDDQVNAIEYIFGGRTLQVFSQAAEYFIPFNVDRAVTPSTVSLERATRHGTSRVKPINSDGATVYVDLSGRVVREYVFLDVEQSYISTDISFQSEHLIQTPVRAALQKAQDNLPGEYSYYVNTDGTLAVLNRRRSQQFIAWSLWETEGDFEDVTVVGNTIYFVVKRTINSSTVRYIEKLSWDYYTDAGKKLTSGSPTTSWSTLSHLEGATVNVRSADGYPLLQNEVDTAAMTTERSETGIEVGLPFTQKVRTVPPEDPQLLLAGKRRRIVTANFNLKDSFGFEVYNNANVSSRVILGRFGSYNFNQAPPAFNGFHRVSLRGFSREPYIEVRQSKPVRFEILSMVLEVTV